MQDEGQRDPGTERSPGMRPYLERLGQVAADSEVAVMVLLNPDNTDLGFWPRKPRAASEMAAENLANRQLRSVGVIGLNGFEPHCAIKEPLDAAVLNAISIAFTAYVKVLIGEDFAAQMKPAKIEELFHLWSGFSASDAQESLERESG